MHKQHLNAPNFSHNIVASLHYYYLGMIYLFFLAILLSASGRILGFTKEGSLQSDLSFEDLNLKIFEALWTKQRTWHDKEHLDF